MEDFILNEINKIGRLLRAIAEKMRLLKAEPSVGVYSVARTELLDQLDIDMDTLPEGEALLKLLIEQHNFGPHELEQFAELMFDMVEADEDRGRQRRLAAGICSIYQYLTSNSNSSSLDRYYIMQELEKYL